MIDSGASRSIMDIDTLESLGLQNEIILDPNIGLTDASNNKMAISRRCTLRLYIPKIRKTFRHEFSILNVKTYKTLLLGRDFLSDIGPVTIDVQENRVKIDNKWIYGEKSKNRLRVNTCADIVSPGRTEQTICVNTKSNGAMLNSDFIPKTLATKGLYVAEAKIRPDINGQFVVSILNVNEYEVTLKKRTMIGNVFPFTVCRVLQNSECPPDDEEIDVLPEIKLGENLTTE